MRAVAKRVGVTHRALYRWYADRDALVAALAAEGFVRMAASVRASVARAAGPAASAAFVEAYVRYSLSESALYRLAMSADRKSLATHRELGAAAKDLVAASLETFGGLGKQARDHVVAMWSLLHGVHELYSGGLLDIADDEAFVRYALGLVRRIGPLAD